MFKPVIRLLAFFTKEINEVRRQPRLVLSLILGPFLIMLLFGVGYQGERLRPRVAMVIPESLAQRLDVNSLREAISANFEVVSADSDANTAQARLASGEVDIVMVLPEDVDARLERGEQSPVRYIYDEINPIDEAWVQYLGYAQVNEMNKSLLLQTTVRMQQEAATNKPYVTEARQNLDALTGDMSQSDLDARRESLRQVRQLVGFILASPTMLAQMSNDASGVEETRAELQALADDLDAMDRAIESGTVDQEQTRIQAARARLVRLEEMLNTFTEVPPQTIVSPLQPEYVNERGQSLNLTTFYAPGVIALILQHIAVTLGALSLVRERLLGAIELFRIAPASPRQVLFGKYLAYTLFIGVIAVVLVLLMRLLGVPFLGDPGIFAAFVLLLILASLGVGFLISSFSKSETQAVQLSMLVLLMSIFFSGFFLPLKNFWEPIRIIAYAIPLTAGIEGIQSLLLSGAPPPPWAWIALGAIAAILFAVVALLIHRQFRLAQ
jgi:ABC-2 type transport system permease protein